MELFNLLEKSIVIFGQHYDVSLNWIGQLIKWLIGGVGIVGVGIILFSLVLKLIVLPFDIYQRIAMRKQNIKMKEQQERMEKLQKQYANDKEKYNQKLMEMYKENGISMFSSCLPMIISMIIFIVAINAFNAYAQYSTIQNYNILVDSYTKKIESYCPDIVEENIQFEIKEGTLESVLVKDADGKNSKEENTYFYYKAIIGETYDEALHTKANMVQHVIDSKYELNPIIDTELVKKDAALMEKINALITDTVNEEQAMHDYFVSQAQEAVVTAYTTEVFTEKNTKFLWVKNIWATDAAYKHPVLSYEEFEASAQRESFDVGGQKVSFGDIHSYTQVYGVDVYNVITAKLEPQKNEANGYFILIALSIGTILLQQFVSMRSQKEQQKYSTVDGQGASQQKMTLVIMTVMFAIFSFMYSSAFSIYMITGNLFSLLSTLIINKLVDKHMEKAEAVKTSAKLDNRGLSRIEAAKQAGKASAQNARGKKSNEGNNDKNEEK